MIDKEVQLLRGKKNYGSCKLNSFEESKIKRDESGKFSAATGRGRIQKQPWDESTKDTPEYDIKLARRKEEKIKKKIEETKEKIAALDKKSSKVATLTKKRDEASAKVKEAEKRVSEIKARMKVLKEKLKKSKGKK